jgi:leucyl/phenylalanyl-tRNA--protein transferase
MLEPENMILLYARGAFPMADESGQVDWYMPEIRTVIPLKDFNIPRSLGKYLKTAPLEFRFDTETMNVIRQCSQRETTWISSSLIEAYEGLCNAGHLHSVEVYENNQLVGGLYGVTYRGAFFGESMFSNKTQASKSALIKLIERLNERGFVLLDVQYQTNHLKMFGATEIPFDEFTRLLRIAYKKEISF